MDWMALTVFSEIADGSSLAKAAEKLRIPPMSATRRLSALEQDLGVRLVYRTTRALSLSPEGQAFLPHARRLLSEREAAYASVRRDGDGAFGLLRVTASIAFGRKVVTPIIARFMEDNPAVRVDLLMTDSVIDIVGEGIDVAVRIANLADSGLMAKRLAANPRLMLASPAYLQRHGTPKTLADLQGHECLYLSGSTHWAFETGNQQQRSKLSGRFSANSIEGLLQACVAGLGIANLSSWFVQEEIKRGELQSFTLEDAIPQPLGIWAVYPSNRMLHPKVRLFVDTLAADLQHSPVVTSLASG